MLDAFGQRSVSVLVTNQDLQIKPAEDKGIGMDHGIGRRFCDLTGQALSKRKLLVGLDLLCLLLASIPFLTCELNAVRPHRTGFICGDPSITYPYNHKEVVSDTLLIAGGIFITTLTIVIGECFRVRFLGISSRSFVRNLYVSRLYKELGGFLFGCFVGQSLTNMAKLSVGRLRPHFLAVCGVTYASLNCTPGTYVASVSCHNSTHPWKRVEEARKSFFSGHASFAMYTALYLAFYLQARLRWSGARLLRPLLQSLLVLLAVYTGLTRVSDHRHHATDVLTGYAQGALTAYWVFYLQARLRWSGARLLRPLLQSLLVLLAVYTGLTRVSDHRHHATDVLTGYAQGALTAYWVAFHVSSMFKSSRRVLSSALSPLSAHHTIC